jgi:hypothetical protein
MASGVRKHLILSAEANIETVGTEALGRGNYRPMLLVHVATTTQLSAHGGYAATWAKYPNKDIDGTGDPNWLEGECVPYPTLLWRLTRRCKRRASPNGRF